MSTAALVIVVGIGAGVTDALSDATSTPANWRLAEGAFRSEQGRGAVDRAARHEHGWCKVVYWTDTIEGELEADPAVRAYDVLDAARAAS